MSLDAEICSAALTERNAEFEGAFYVGVRTTGVFCRPTCPARLPKRENCEFFADARRAISRLVAPWQVTGRTHPGER